jgi:SAM-dependent methyltransferase
VPASEWSTVDAAADPGRLLTGLDALRAEPFFAESKARMAAILETTATTRVIDVGCGTGEDAAALAGLAIGLERSVVMCTEARSRFPMLALVGADAAALPIRADSVDAVRADRVLQHLPDPHAALQEWRRVVQRGGRMISFDPDLTTASIEGVDDRSAAVILEWRVNTRPGAPAVHGLRDALEACAFVDVRVESLALDLTDLDQADGIMGLAGWGHAAADAGALSNDAAQRWSDDVHRAAQDGTLRYRCVYLLAAATAG